MCVVQVWVGGTKSPDLGIEGEALTPEVVGRQPSPMGYLISNKAARYVLDRGGHQGPAMAPGPSRYDNRSESFPTTPPTVNRESPPPLLVPLNITQSNQPKIGKGVAGLCLSCADGVMRDGRHWAAEPAVAHK